MAFIYVKKYEELSELRFISKTFYNLILGSLEGAVIETHILPNGDAFIRDNFYLEKHEYNLLLDYENNT